MEIEVDTYGRSRKYTGHIDSIAAASGGKFSLLPPENATGNYVKVVQRIPVKIVLEPGQNDDQRLLPGMSVTPDRSAQRLRTVTNAMATATAETAPSLSPNRRSGNRNSILGSLRSP